MIKIVTVVGARPQFIKASALSRHFNEKHKADIQEIIIHTGQHFDHNMSDVFFKELQIPIPKYHLNINGLTHGKMTGRMLEGVEEILIQENPDYVLVYGDTNSTLAGALAARKLNINIVHVEAGLRSFNMQMPEEVNRILTDRMSDVLCCPTIKAIDNLQKEGFTKFNCKIELTGDIMEDSVKYFEQSLPKESEILTALNLKKEEYILCTLHRQENVDNPERLKQIINALNKISSHHKIVIPLHPRTKQKIQIDSKKIIMLEPLGYLNNLELLKNCKLVMTDSGGLQKEAYFFQKFCITLRDETEWLELCENDCNIVTGADESRILKAFQMTKNKQWHAPANLYGGGEAAEKICSTIIAHSKGRNS